MVKSAMLAIIRVSISFHISLATVRRRDVLRFRRLARYLVLWIVFLSSLVIFMLTTFMMGTSAMLAKVKVPTSSHISPITIRQGVVLLFRRLARRRELWVAFLSSLVILVPATCMAMHAMLAKIKVSASFRISSNMLMISPWATLALDIIIICKKRGNFSAEGLVVLKGRFGVVAFS
jgi:hypothetical protein